MRIHNDTSMKNISFVDFINYSRLHLLCYTFQTNYTYWGFSSLPGNEARHFTLVDDTVANQNAGAAAIPSPSYTYTTMPGISASYVGEFIYSNLGKMNAILELICICS